MLGMTIHLGAGVRTATIDGHTFDLNAMDTKAERRFRRMTVTAFEMKATGGK